ncbi:MAG: glycosyltransferase family 4 protein [Porphyromonadaceae bacterium]|nr:glycosyltransferase family 4 protein [Porphyromonadaceae bacterium]
MKIAYCIPAMANSGGMERVLSCKANYLVSLGYEVHIITSDQMGRPVFFPLDSRIHLHDLGIDHEATNGSLWRKVLEFPFKRWRHERALKALLLKLRADVVISMFGLESSFLPQIQDGSRKILEYHFSKLKRLQYNRKGLWRRLDIWYTKQDEVVVRRYDDFVVLTEEDRQLWGDLPNIHVIPNPLPFESDEVSTCAAKSIIAAGRYNYQKNFEELIDIWAQVVGQFPDWTLNIYGDGEERAHLQSQIDKRAIPNIYLQRPTKDMPHAYLQSSLYVMTSHYEGLPMVLLEAQTMGLPIVAYACQCGPRDIITDGKDGYVIEPHHKQAFCQALVRLMQDEDLRRQMGANAKVASKRYQLESVMAQWLELLTN